MPTPGLCTLRAGSTFRYAVLSDQQIGHSKSTRKTDTVQYKVKHRAAQFMHLLCAAKELCAPYRHHQVQVQKGPHLSSRLACRASHMAHMTLKSGRLKVASVAACSQSNAMTKSRTMIQPRFLASVLYPTEWQHPSHNEHCARQHIKPKPAHRNLQSFRTPAT